METIREPIVESKYDVECKNKDCRAILRCTIDELNNYLDRNVSVYEMICPHCKINTYIGNFAILRVNHTVGR